MQYSLSSLILCGGKGSRLKKIGKTIPKCLVKVNGEFFIKYILTGLKKKYIKKIVVSGFHRFRILDKTLTSFKIKNLILYNDGNISILDRIKKNLLREKTSLLVCYGDEYANINLNKLVKDHFESKKLLTITTIKIKSNFGILKKIGNSYNFFEKPFIGNCNIGYMIFDTKNIKYMSGYKSLPNYINKLAKINQINLYSHNKKHVTINTIEDIILAERKLNKMINKK